MKILPAPHLLLPVIFSLTTPLLHAEQWLPATEEQLQKDWSWIRPKTDGHYFLKDALVLKTYPGSTWGKSPNKGQNLLVRPLGKKNATITLKFKCAPSTHTEQAGMMIYFDDDHYIKLVRELLGKPGKNKIIFAREQNAKGKVFGNVPSTTATLELRMIIAGDKVTAHLREDPKSTFKQIGETTLPESGLAPKICLFSFSIAKGAAQTEATYHSLTVE